jgi:uncharacterized metal-binding protein
MPNPDPQVPRCASCDTRVCRAGTDCFDAADRHRVLYESPDIARLHEAASAVEARHYGKEPRLGEIILFARELGCRTVGLAFCIGLADEAGVVEQVLSRHFEVVSVCCKATGLDKTDRNLEQILPGTHEVMCNPAGQADLLNRAGTDINILCGLCVGHDAIFSRASQAPVTTLIVKDRVLAHNPVGAIYCPYVRRRLVDDGRE